MKPDNSFCTFAPLAHSLEHWTVTFTNWKLCKLWSYPVLNHVSSQPTNLQQRNYACVDVVTACMIVILVWQGWQTSKVE